MYDKDRQVASSSHHINLFLYYCLINIVQTKISQNSFSKSTGDLFKDLQ